MSGRHRMKKAGEKTIILQILIYICMYFNIYICVYMCIYTYAYMYTFREFRDICKYIQRFQEYIYIMIIREFRIYIMIFREFMKIYYDIQRDEYKFIYSESSGIYINIFR